MMKRNNRFTQIIAAVVGCFVIATSGYSQQTEKGKLEATGQLGVVAGVGTHVSLGTSIGTAVSDHVFAFGEFSWIPVGGASTTIQYPNNFFELATGGKLLTFMAGAHYQFRQTRSFIPYAGASLGVVHASGSTTQTINGVTTTTSFSSDNFYIGLSGGARYYVNDNWGFKPELTIFAGDDSFVRLGGGIFYQFGR